MMGEEPAQERRNLWDSNVDRMTSSTNGLSEAEIQMNLRKLDPCIQEIMAHSSQVQLYKCISKNSSDGNYVQTKVAGALFVYQREAAPKYGFLIMNRNSKENMVEMVTTELDFHMVLGDASQGGAYLLYRKTKPADGSPLIFGIWFCNEGECEAVSVKIKDIQKVLARQEALRQKVNEEENSGWSHSRKRGGFAQQAGGDSWGDNFLQGRPGNVANSGWMMGEEPAQERRNLWDSNVFGQPEIRRHQPVARFVALAFGKYPFLLVYITFLGESVQKNVKSMVSCQPPPSDPQSPTNHLSILY